MNLDGFAAAAQAMADRAESELAVEVARAGAKELLAAMFVATPVLSGALRHSETVQSVGGSGAHAVALVGPNVIYDKFRNDGGTIHSKGPWPLRNRATGQVFGRSVTQAGCHYMERAEEEGAPMVEAAGQIALSEILTL